MSIPKNVIFPLRRTGRLSMGPQRHHLFAVPNDPYEYSELTAGKGWKTGMVGPSYNHREERRRDNAGNLVVPYHVMQLHMPVLLAQVHFSTGPEGDNFAFGRQRIGGMGEMDGVVRDQKGAGEGAQSYRLVGKSRSGGEVKC